MSFRLLVLEIMLDLVRKTEDDQRPSSSNVQYITEDLKSQSYKILSLLAQHEDQVSNQCYTNEDSSGSDNVVVNDYLVHLAAVILCITTKLICTFAVLVHVNQCFRVPAHSEVTQYNIL